MPFPSNSFIPPFLTREEKKTWNGTLMLWLFGSRNTPSKKPPIPPGLSGLRLRGFAAHLSREGVQEFKESNFMDLLGVGTMGRLLDALFGAGVMLLYPLYASMCAIESPSALDDQQWLTYWVLYSLITLFELSCWTILQWFPLWRYMKIVFCLWLVLPISRGAAYIHEKYVRNYVKIGSYVMPSYTEEQRKVLQMMALDARNSVEKYIEKYGAGKFTRVLKAAEKEARKR